VNQASIVAYLGFLQAKKISVHGKWVTASCVLAPWTHDSGKDLTPSFAIRIMDNGQSYYHCFACHSGGLDDLIVDLQHYKAGALGYELGKAWGLVEAEFNQKLALVVKDWGDKSPEVEEDVVFPEAWLEQFQKAWPVPMAREYLEYRMVKKWISEYLDLRWDKSLRTVCFPIRNAAGELVSLRGRFIDPKPGSAPYHLYPFLKQTGGQAWLGENTVDYSKPILMVESVFDYTSCLRVYQNIVSPLTVGINKERVKRVGKGSDYVTLFDRGKGGNKARAVVSKHLGSALVFHVLPTEKDAGAMEENDLRELLKGYLKLKPLTNAA
jgi:hypothetical protein